MESKSTSCGGVLRRRTLGESSRYDPYAVTGNNNYNHMKEEAVQFGVELSLIVAKSMFLLCDDKTNMLFFCYMIYSVIPGQNNYMSESLVRVMHHVYSNDIIPNNRLYQDPIQPYSINCGFIGSAWEDFAYGIRVLHSVVMLLRKKGFPFGQEKLSTLDVVDLKQRLMKKVEDKLRDAKDASEVNGFARERLESSVIDIWKSLFNEEEDKEEAKATRLRLIGNLFQPLLGESWQPMWGRRSSQLPRIQLPLYVVDKDVAKQEQVIRLGVELSLYVAESMFLLCDDIPSVVLFCVKLWRDIEKDLNNRFESPVIESLARVFEYVYFKHIKPMNGVFHKDGKSVQWELAMAACKDFHGGFRDLDLLVRLGGQEFTTFSIDQALKNVEEKLRCAKSVSKANGFERNAMESDILVLWKSLFENKPIEDLWAMKMMRYGILNDMLHPLRNDKSRSKKS